MIHFMQQSTVTMQYSEMRAGVLLTLVLTAQCSSFTPHFIIFTVDDMGFGDSPYGKTGSDVPAPKLALYANHSVILDKYYTHPHSFASRAALLTGKHPAKLGYQDRPSDSTIPHGLDLNAKLLPEYLKELGVGYKTHAVGQWDLGFYSTKLLPTSRGYDTFYGSYLGYGDYKEHTATDSAGHSGLDLHDDHGSERQFDQTQQGVFKTEAYISRAVRIIQEHDPTKPLHLYIALQAAQIRGELRMCSDSTIPNDYYRQIPNSQVDTMRKCYLALLNAVDDAYSRVMEQLLISELLQNSVVIFTTTSGGAASGPNLNFASNYPLRGTKGTLWEGGLRGLSTVYSTISTTRNSRPFRPDCVVHISDWVPTILQIFYKQTQTPAPSSSSLEVEDWYGVDLYSCLYPSDGTPSAQNRFIVHYINGNSAAVTSGGYKLLTDEGSSLTSMGEFYNEKSGSTLCTQSQTMECRPSLEACVFNLNNDQCERNNIAKTNTGKTKIGTLMEHLRLFNESVAHITVAEPDCRGNPAYLKHQAWQPWEDVNQAPSSATTSLVVALFASLTLAL